MLIMWTSNRDDFQEHNWIPNHFVPILPKCTDSELTMDFKEDFIEDSADDSMKETLIQDILQHLYELVNI